MKNLVINLLASWAGTISTFQDGDVFRESQIDIAAGSVADRLGYLKTQVDGKGAIASTNSWTGDNTWGGTGYQLFEGTGSFTVDKEATINGTLEANGAANMYGPVSMVHIKSESSITLADANATLSDPVIHCRVPTLTANRVYTLPTGATDQVVRIEKLTTAAFTATIQDPTGPTTIAVLDASAAGWVEVIKRGSSWRVAAWGGSVSSLSAGV